MHAEEFAAGELRHGPIALIDDDMPVIVVMPSPKAATLYAKLLSNIREVQTRGAVTIVIAEEGDDTVRPYADYLIEIPAVSTLSSCCCRPFRCRCLPPQWRRPAVTTSTSRGI